MYGGTRFDSTSAVCYTIRSTFAGLALVLISFDELAAELSLLCHVRFQLRQTHLQVFNSLGLAPDQVFQHAETDRTASSQLPSGINAYQLSRANGYAVDASDVRSGLGGPTNADRPGFYCCWPLDTYIDVVVPCRISLSGVVADECVTASGRIAKSGRGAEERVLLPSGVIVASVKPHKRIRVAGLPWCSASATRPVAYVSVLKACGVCDSGFESDEGVLV